MQHSTGLGRFAGLDVRQRIALVKQTLNQQLDLAAAGFMAQQAGLDDLGVIEHQQVVRAQQAQQVGEPAVMQLAVLVKMQQPAGRALGRRLLGDKVGRKFVIEIGQLQVGVHGKFSHSF